MQTFHKLSAVALILAACSTDGGGDGTEFVSIPLASTRLVGTYTLVDYLFEYGDGKRADPSIVPLTGTLSIKSDSVYLEEIVLAAVTTPTKGRILKVLAQDGDPDKGQLELDLEQGDSAAVGKSDYTFRHDTLVLVTEVSKERDSSKKGFKETAYYRRD